MTGSPLTAGDLASATASEAALRGFLDDLPPVDERAVRSRVESLAAPAVTRREVDAAIGLLDLTTLEATDTPGKVRALAERGLRPAANDPGVPPVAAICVYPDLVGAVAEVLSGTGVAAAAVAGGFPSGRTSRRIKVAEAREALAAGADEIDMVLDRGAFLDGRYGDALEDVVALREACGDARLKVILETGELRTLDAAWRGAWLALLGGADFVKTSTGKSTPAATPEAALVLLEAARDYGRGTGRTVGVKAAGGIRTTADALRYVALARSVGGPEAATASRLRLGASSLLDDLLARRD